MLMLASLICENILVGTHELTAFHIQNWVGTSGVVGNILLWEP